MKTCEANLICKLRSAAAKFSSKSGIVLGIGDDAALFKPRPGYETIFTCDWFLEGTHFLRDKHPADSVGWKSLARAVSDIAAMGGEPRCFLLSLALPETLTGRWLDEFLGGLGRASRKLHCPLAGGDTTRQRNVLINITVVGEIRQNRAILRSGARPGDIIYVSGRLGEAELGLHLWSAATRRRFRGVERRAASLNSHSTKASHAPRSLRSLLASLFPNPAAINPSVKKHLYPESRLVLAQWLTKNRLPTAMMDLSDGFSTDLPRLCAASRVGAQLEAAQIPTTLVPNWSGANKPTPLALALNGGDDYELLFTVSPAKARLLPSKFRGLPLTPVGKITRARRIALTQTDGRTSPLLSAGWDPFRQFG